MDPNACLCYPSQLEVYSDLPQALLTMPHFLSQWGKCSLWGSWFRSSLAVHRQHPVVIGRRGTLSSSGCLYVRASGYTLTAQSPESRRQVRLGFGSEFIYVVVTS
jgi:hypothetical protein